MKTIKLLTFLLLLFPSISFCKPTPMIIDTDMDLDNVMALLYLLQSSQISIKAILVDGNGSAHCNPGITNLYRLIKLTNHSEIPIACGSEKALGFGHSFTADERNKMDQLAGVNLPKAKYQPSTITAPQLLITTLKNQPEKTTLFTMGSFTIIAQAITTSPVVKNKVDHIYSMGGAILVPGNINDLIKSDNTRAEWNIYFDPLAAKIVLSSGIPITLISLDITNKFPITQKFYQKLAKENQSGATRTVLGLLSANSAMLNSGYWYFWDPLAAVIATHPEIATFKQVKLKVLLTPEKLSGALEQSPNGYPVNMVTQVDYEKFEKLFLDGLRTKGTKTP